VVKLDSSFAARNPLNPVRRPFLLLVLTFGVAVGWLLLAKFVAAPVIASAYRGESLPVLNRAIAGRDVHSLDFYLDDWDRVTRNVCVLITATGLTLSILVHPRFQRFVDSRWPVGTCSADTVHSMPRYRVLLVQFLIVFIVGLSGYAIARPVELWPFSPYPMYAGIARGTSLTYLRLYGVLDGQDAGEIPLVDLDYIYPFDDGKLNDMIHILLRAKEPGRIESVLEDLSNRYEQRRQDGEHGGPRLKGMKVYRLRWSIDPWAANQDRPEVKELIAEVQG
jgi:hypothetical protein